MGLERRFVGKTYREQSYGVELAAMRAFARATNEDNPALAGEAAAMASPMFAVVYLLPCWLEVFFDQELMADADIGRMVHAGQDMRFLAPVRPGDVITTGCTVAGIETKDTGEMLGLACRSRNQDGVDVLHSAATFFFRGPADPARVGKKPVPTAIPSVLFEREVRVDTDQAVRYAEASGDHNPIHLDEDVAKAVGLPRPIVHGLCVMALGQKAILDHAGPTRPSRLKRLSVQFAKVVYPGDRLICTAWEVARDGAIQTIGFVMRSQRGDEVVRGGVAELGPPESP